MALRGSGIRTTTGAEAPLPKEILSAALKGRSSTEFAEIVTTTV